MRAEETTIVTEECELELRMFLEDESAAVQETIKNSSLPQSATQSMMVEMWESAKQGFPVHVPAAYVNAASVTKRGFESGSSAP